MKYEGREGGDNGGAGVDFFGGGLSTIVVYKCSPYPF